MSNDLEQRCDAAMMNIYRRAHSEANYNATRYPHTVGENGGLGNSPDFDPLPKGLRRLHRPLGARTTRPYCGSSYFRQPAGGIRSLRMKNSRLSGGVWSSTNTDCPYAGDPKRCLLSHQ
jgi:hypothetical protein